MADDGIDIGDVLTLTASYTVGGVLTDPTTPTGAILLSDGTEIALQLAKQSTGVYTATFAPTMDGTHFVRFDGTGAATCAGETSFTVNKRIVPFVSPQANVIPQIPIISRSAQVQASAGNTPEGAVDGAYGSLWHSVTSPNGGTPQWLALDLRTIASTDKSELWAVMKSHVTTTFGGGLIQGIPASALGPQAVSNYAGVPCDYKIQGHASAGSLPASNDPGWTDVVSVTNNNYHTRIHTGIDLSSYNWVRFYCSRSSGVAGVTDDVGMEIDLRDVRNGTDDSIFCYGDSITEEAFGLTRPDNSLWLNLGPMEDAIEAVTLRWAPVLVDGGTIGWTASDADQYKDTFLPLYPCKYVFLALGSNDANVANIDLTTLGGLNSTYVKTYKAHMQSIVNYAYSLGKTCIIPHIPWGDLDAWSTVNVGLLNQAIDALIAANPGKVIPGPDFYAFFAANHNALVDHLHPTYDNSVSGGLVGGLTGYENYLKLWRDWMVAHLYT